jgi:hypothetical protein
MSLSIWREIEITGLTLIAKDSLSVIGIASRIRVFFITSSAFFQFDVKTNGLFLSSGHDSKFSSEIKLGMPRAKHSSTFIPIHWGNITLSGYFAA